MIKTHKHQSSCQINLGISYVRIRLHKGQQKVQHEVIYVLTISFFVKVGDKYIRIKVYIKRGVIQE